MLVNKLVLRGGAYHLNQTVARAVLADITNLNYTTPLLSPTIYRLGCLRNKDLGEYNRFLKFLGSLHQGITVSLGLILPPLKQIEFILKHDRLFHPAFIKTVRQRFIYPKRGALVLTELAEAIQYAKR